MKGADIFVGVSALQGKAVNNEFLSSGGKKMAEICPPLRWKDKIHSLIDVYGKENRILMLVKVVNSCFSG